MLFELQDVNYQKSKNFSALHSPFSTLLSFCVFFVKNSRLSSFVFRLFTIFALWISNSYRTTRRWAISPRQ